MTSTPLAYIEHGLSIIPLEPKGKRPLIKWEPFQHRLPTPEQVMRWAQEHPGCNWAIITGAVSGVVVLDLDNDEAAQEAKRRGIPSDAPVVRTGKGWHLYFKHPGHHVQNAVRAFPGADIRGDGGYVVAPPSVHPSGAVYRWAEGRSILEIEPPPLPEWLEELLNKPQEPVMDVGSQAVGTSDLAVLARGVDEGQRNDAAARLIGHLLAKGVDPFVTAELMRAWNQRNRPPLPDSEIVSVVTSISKRELAKRTNRAKKGGQAS